MAACTLEEFAIYPDLQGQVALIMGIGQVGLPSLKTWGNGAAVARVLSHNGIKVFGCDLNLTAAERTVSRIRQDNPDAVCDVVAADVTKADDVKRVVEGCLSRHNRIDILINNVGMTAPGDPSTMTETTWDSQIDLNLKSVYLACHTVLPVMSAQEPNPRTGSRGVIINNGSITALRYIGKSQIAYASAKAAVVQFTKATAAMPQYALNGIRMNCVIPGLILTPLVENLGVSEKEEDREVYRKITDHNVPMGCMGDSFDVANAVAFLVSKSARYITGHSLVVDGGVTVSTGTGWGQ